MTTHEISMAVAIASQRRELYDHAKHTQDFLRKLFGKLCDEDATEAEKTLLNDAISVLGIIQSRSTSHKAEKEIEAYFSETTN